MAGIPLGGEEELIFRRRLPVGTIGLVVANVLVYIYTSYQSFFLQTSSYYVYNYGFVPALLLQHPLQGFVRIFTSMFLHANLLHIFFNMYFLYVFGRAVENALGTGRYLALYFLSGIAASIFHTTFTYLGGVYEMGIPAIGASGAISGVLGAYLVLFPGTSLTVCWWFFFLPFCFTLRASAYLIFWFALQVINGYLAASTPGGAGVAFFAHVGGFLTGIALLPLVIDRVRHRYLKMRAELITRFMDYIRYVYEGIERAGLGALAKGVLTALIVAIVAGSAYAFAISGSICSCYHLETTIKGVPQPISMYIPVPKPGMGMWRTPITEINVLLNRLTALKVFWDPKWAQYVGRTVSTYVEVDHIPLKVPVRLRIFDATYVHNLLVYMRGELYTQAIILRWGSYVLGAWIGYYFTLELVRMYSSLLQGLAIISLITSLWALYVIHRRSPELTLIG